MKRRFPAILAIVLSGLFLSMGLSRAAAGHVWHVASPDHEQTFSYGSEQSRVWAARGNPKHLALLLNYTNDPYVDRTFAREYDSFTFAFPNILLAPDGRTFFYRTPDGRSIPVAARKPGFLGMEEIELLPNASLIVKKPHGYISLILVIWDQA
jgi:hypothetical protein